MGCHSRARTLKTRHYHTTDTYDYPSANFTFTLNNAQPSPEDFWAIPNPNSLEPATDLYMGTWRQVLEGFKMAEHTYESNALSVKAKLHCSSCHLKAGRKPTAAWWYGVFAKYLPEKMPRYNKKKKNPNPDNWDKTYGWLPYRINGCLQRSMNGEILCDTSKGECDKNDAMLSFIAYMRWIDKWIDDRTKQAKHMTIPDFSKWNGFPSYVRPAEPADAKRGERIFRQKCAVCHGEDGQGRYGNDNDTYFRPALWGSYSFNQSAGFYKKHDKLAGFIRWNMPLGYGGMITDREAGDLAAYIHSKVRPPALSGGNHDYQE